MIKQPNWHLIVFEHTQFKQSEFFSKKDEMVEEAKKYRSFFKKEDGSNKFTHPRDIIDATTCPKVDVGGGRKLYK